MDEVVTMLAMGETSLIAVLEEILGLSSMIVFAVVEVLERELS